MLGNINVEMDASHLNEHLDIVTTLVYMANEYSYTYKNPNGNVF
jgi:hypothetical protein